MIITAITTALLIAPSIGGDLLAIRVGRAETVSQGSIENAVILVEDGKIVTVGEDLPIERGIPVVDLPDWVVTPGLVNCYSRLGMDSRGGNGFEPQRLASGELYWRQDAYRDVLEAGVTTLGLYPPGGGVPGQAVAVRPHGESSEEMIVAESVYLMAYMRTNSAAKKMLRDAFEKVDEHDEKVAKALEKWEKDQERKKKKKKKSSRSKKDKDEDEEEEKKDEEKKEDEKKGEEKDAGKKEDETSDAFEPPAPGEKVVPFIELRAQRLSALVNLQKASDYLHFLDVVEEEDFSWSLFLYLRNDVDFYNVAEKVGEREVRVVMAPRITLQPGSKRERNLPAEFQRAGAKVVLVPAGDDVDAHEEWLHDVGLIIGAGLDRDAALAAVTLEAAEVLGLGERIGSIDEGKDANLVFWSGDPFEPSSQVEAVMLEGEVVVGDLR